MKIHLSLIRCRYCEHANPADAKFCSACGGELHLPPHLTSCLHCGAVNPVKTTVCIWCHKPLTERKAGALVPSSPAAKPSKSLPSMVFAGAVALAAIAALGYYGYHQTSLANVPAPGAASSEATTDTNSAKADDTSPASKNPPAAPARAAANPPRAGRQPVESQEGGAAAAAITRSPTINVDRPSGQEACTEALAALGLCATKPEAGKAGGQEPSRTAACTAEAAVLGLCAPRATQRRE